MKNLLLLLPILSIICFSCLKDIDDMEQVTSPYDPEYETPYVDVEKITIHDTLLFNNQVRCYAKIHFKVNETSFNRMKDLSETETIRLEMRRSSDQYPLNKINVENIELGKTYIFRHSSLNQICGTEICRDFLYVYEAGGFLGETEYDTTPQNLNCFILEQ